MVDQKGEKTKAIFEASSGRTFTHGKGVSLNGGSVDRSGWRVTNKGGGGRTGICIGKATERWGRGGNSTLVRGQGRKKKKEKGGGNTEREEREKQKGSKLSTIFSKKAKSEKGGVPSIQRNLGGGMGLDER